MAQLCILVSLLFAAHVGIVYCGADPHYRVTANISPYRWDAYKIFIGTANNYGFTQFTPISVTGDFYNYQLRRFNNYDLTFDAYTVYGLHRCQVKVVWPDDGDMEFDNLSCSPFKVMG